MTNRSARRPSAGRPSARRPLARRPMAGGLRSRAMAVVVACTALGATVAGVAPSASAAAPRVSSSPRAAASTAPDVAGVSCRPAVGFSRTGAGALYALQDDAVLTGNDSLKELGQAGRGWTGSAFAWTGTGGDGVVYALTWTGVLKWFRYDVGRKAWLSGSGRTVGSGLVPRTRIANISLGGDGEFYVVRTDGKLVIYKHTGRLTGAASWATGGGWVVGTGWTGKEIIVPNGDGTIYVQQAGKLYWMRHSDPASGPVTWSDKRLVGSGWRFYDLLPAGAGVIYATQGGTGDVVVYRHGDPVGGANVWASSTGLPKYTARPDSFGIVIDPLACTVDS